VSLSGEGAEESERDREEGGTFLARDQEKSSSVRMSLPVQWSIFIIAWAGRAKSNNIHGKGERHCSLRGRIRNADKKIIFI
jgi:hypothetical protein